jgi:hypothetical protein
MTEIKPTTKAKQSIDALKGANKHLDELFKHQSNMESCLGSVSNDLKRIADQCGDLYVNHYFEGRFLPRPLKATLHELSDKLEKARS